MIIEVEGNVSGVDVRVFEEIGACLGFEGKFEVFY